MFDLISKYQLDIMLALSAACFVFVLLLFFTRFLERRRRIILLLLEFTATLLISFDRMAYIYRGDVSSTGYVMVRLSNFMVFFLTSAIVFAFNLYVSDLLASDRGASYPQKRLVFAGVLSACGMILAVIAHFTGIYYYFDEMNVYHRGSGFLSSYIIPFLCPMVLFTVIIQYRKRFSRLIYTSLLLYLFVPLAAAVIQIFAYGLSLVNTATVLVCMSIYIFAYLDVNEAVMRAHRIELGQLQEANERMNILVDQMVSSVLASVEKRRPNYRDYAVKVADVAKRVASLAGKNESQCRQVYFAAMLHDVGLVAMPDDIAKKDGNYSKEEYEFIKQKPQISGEIMSYIKEFPDIEKGVRYSHERYDGSGYPEGLAGEDIPEIARIIAVSDVYANMTSKKSYRDPLPYQKIREEFISKSGTSFDPKLVRIMVDIVDKDFEGKEVGEAKLEEKLVCGEYRNTVSLGIPIEKEVIKISFICLPQNTDKDVFWAPSIILFDAYDRRVHDNDKAIEAYRYLEYGEAWFDGHYVQTSARRMVSNVEKRVNCTDNGLYEMTVKRYEDHVSITMESSETHVETILVLPELYRKAYIGLTGENCIIKDISVQPTGEITSEVDIPKIADAISYIDRMESDLPNVQINSPLSAATEGITVKDGLLMEFHTMSISSINLVWNCPYIVLFHSDDKRVNGKGYREYALIKLNGEVSGDKDYAENDFSMKKTEDFAGWDDWKEKNKAGLECKVLFRRKGNRITLKTENLGISIENITTIHDGNEDVYMAITGDQIAITDIRIKGR